MIPNAGYDNSLAEADRAADRAITAMTVAAAGCAVIPIHVNWVAFCTTLGGGVVYIGHCYGVRASREEGWKLIVRFFIAAGFGFMALTFGAKFITAVMKSTGFPYPVGVLLDAVFSAAIAYAVGQSAKAYFRGERRKLELGRIFREAFEQQKLVPVPA